MTTEFDYPIGDQLPDPPWGTWVKGRGFRTHAKLATAKSALSTARDHQNKFHGGVLYRVVGSKWVPFVVVRPGTQQKDYLLWSAPKKFEKAPGITVLLTENPFS